MKRGTRLITLAGLVFGWLPFTTTAQVVVLSAPDRSVNTAQVQAGAFNTNIQPVLPQAQDSGHFFEIHPTTTDRRDIGIGSQASAPTIAPQFNQPMIGQQGPPPLQTGLPQQAQALPPGVQPGLSDQGLIFPAPGTIIVGPQGDTAVIGPQGGALGLGPKVTALGPQGQATAIGPNNIAPAINPNNIQPALNPQSRTALGQPQIPPVLTPTGRGALAPSSTGSSSSGGR